MRDRTVNILKVDSSVPANEVIKTTVDGEPGFEFVEKEEYQYLTALPLCENGAYVPMCSKDLKHWVICFGARLDGELINVNDIAMQMEEQDARSDKQGTGD